MTESRETLLDQLADQAYRWSPTPMILSSGQMSNEYLDCRAALTDPKVLSAVGFEVLQRVRGCAAVGGLTMGADPIAISTSLQSHGTDEPIHWFSVRKEPKRHGTSRVIEGRITPLTKVAVVDDVLTSGSSITWAIHQCRLSNLEVVKVVALVDRQEQDGRLSCGGNVW